MRKILNILSLYMGLLVSTVLFFSFITPGYAMDVTLQWDANSEPDLNHYVVYWGDIFKELYRQANPRFFWPWYWWQPFPEPVADQQGKWFLITFPWYNEWFLSYIIDSASFYPGYNSAASDSSEHCSLTTLTTSNDTDSNRIPDAQEVDSTVDLDGDGTSDYRSKWYQIRDHSGWRGAARRACLFRGPDLG